MAGVKTLTILVSANGYGHIRRQILIARELLHRFDNFRITFALTDRQYQRFKLEIEALGQKAEVVAGITEDSVRWRHDPENYTDANLNGWESEWKSHARLVNSDFIISDNLVGVLEKRPDAVLSGSFLWHEVIASYSDCSDACKRFVQREISLLQQNTPKMICNQSLASKAVIRLTSAVGVSWMIDEVVEQSINASRIAILVHGGGTRTLDSKVLEITKKLRHANFKVFTDIEDDQECFDYRDKTWRTIGVVVCRPGAGTATECVKWKIPMIVIRDEENSEAEFIAERLTSLGLAHGFIDGLGSDQLTDLAKDAVSIEKRSMYLEPFERCVRNGISEAADFLENHWKLNERTK